MGLSDQRFQVLGAGCWVPVPGSPHLNAPDAPVAPSARRVDPPARIDSPAQHIRNRLRDRLRIAIAARQQLQLRHRALADGVGDRVLDRLVNEGLIAEPHFRLRRMHVHIDAIGGNLEEEMHLRAAFLDRRVAVRLDNRVRDRLVLHDAPVDEDVLGASRRPLLGKRGHEAFDAEAGQRLPHRHEIGPFAKHLIQPVFELRHRRPVEHRPRSAGQREADLRISKRELRDDARDLRRFARVGLEKLAPRRQVVEEIADFDRGAFGRADFLDGRHRAAVDAYLGARDVAAQPRLHHEMRHRRDARQRFAAEPERVNGGEIVGALNLARRVALEREPRILRAHPLAVVFDAHKPLAAQSRCTPGCGARLRRWRFR